jgi:hypothetical protein
MPLTQEQKNQRKENIKQMFSPEAIQGYAQAAIGIGTSVADTVRNQKIEKERTKAAISDIRGGGSGFSEKPSQPQPSAPAENGSDKILGMNKPIFFGGLGLVFVVAGVGIYFATKGSSAEAAK